jgi:hypothetical protein
MQLNGRCVCCVNRLDVESEAPPCGAVLFAGETLARLTNGRFYPTHHEVVSSLGACGPCRKSSVKNSRLFLMVVNVLHYMTTLAGIAQGQ